MKAIVTVINDEGKILAENKEITPYEVTVDIEKEANLAIRNTIFRFGIGECRPLNDILE